MGASMQEAAVEQGTSTDTTEFDVVDVIDVSCWARVQQG